MRSNTALRALTVLGLGAAGLIGGHALGYAIAVPDDVHRTTLLDATGHGYLPSASRLAVIFGIAAVIAGIVSGAMHRGSRGWPSWSAVAARIGVLQCAGFVVLEGAERMMASAPMSTLSTGVLVVGMLSQLVVALAVALLVVGVRRLGAAIGARVTSARATTPWRTVDVSDRVAFSRAPLRERVRGPPCALPL